MADTRKKNDTLFIMTRCGILAAMAVILYYIEIPVVAFYKLDLSTLPAILAARRSGIPVFLHDGNARVGKANRFRQFQIGQDTRNDSYRYCFQRH